MNNIIKILLLPFSWIYAAVVWVRNLLFSEHVLPSFSVSVPTICVGNIAVGGTGKTPHVEYLLRLLGPRYKVAMLSRGYGRKTKGFVLADESSTALTIGDEPMQIHQKFPSVPVAVCADRVHGVHCLQKLFPDLQVVILDDAFQHRRLRCGFNILLTAHDNLYVNDDYLPVGRLRDNPSQSLRANVIVVSKCSPQMQPIEQRIIINELQAPMYQNIYFSSMRYPEIDWSHIGGKVLLVTGLACPQYLTDYLKSHHVEYELLSYCDHHFFSKKEIDLIEKKASGVNTIITTEKDAVRLALHEMSDELKKKMLVLPIEVQLSNQAQFDRQVLLYVDENIKQMKMKK